VLGREGGEDAGGGARLLADQQLEPEGAPGIELVALADDEQRHLPAELDAVEYAAAHVARALEGVAAVGEHREHMLARLELAHDPLILVVTEEVATHRGGVDDGEPEIDEDLVVGRRRGIEPRAEPAQRLVDLGRGQAQMAVSQVAGS